MAISAYRCFVGNCQANRCLPSLRTYGATTKTQVRAGTLFVIEAARGLGLIACSFAHIPFECLRGRPGPRLEGWASLEAAISVLCASNANHTLVCGKRVAIIQVVASVNRLDRAASQPQFATADNSQPPAWVGMFRTTRQPTHSKPCAVVRSSWPSGTRRKRIGSAQKGHRGLGVSRSIDPA